MSAIARLHEVVDELVAPLVARHQDRLQCRLGCAACCVDEITVFEVEADRIAAAFPEVLDSEPHPPGACAMLDAEGACRVYAARPYVCRTQGLPLRWAERRRGRTVELRDICPLNETGPGLATLPVADCWTLGPVEQRLQQLQLSLDGQGKRVLLRALFRR